MDPVTESESATEPELHLLRGRMLRDEKALRHALKSARDRSALWWELKAALALAELRPGAELRKALANALDRLSEGRDMPLARAARRALIT